jgi:hypothetical protein
VSDDQTQNQTTRKPGRCRRVWLKFALALMAYMLSTGPIIKLVGTPRAVQVFYAPLGILTDASETAEAVFEWYVHSLWGAK